MVSVRLSISHSSNPFTEPLGIVPSATIIIGPGHWPCVKSCLVGGSDKCHRYIHVPSLFQFSGNVQALASLFVSFLICDPPGQQSPQVNIFSFFFFPFLLTSTKSDFSNQDQVICLYLRILSVYSPGRILFRTYTIWQNGQVLLSGTISSESPSPTNHISSCFLFAIFAYFVINGFVSITIKPTLAILLSLIFFCFKMIVYYYSLLSSFSHQHLPMVFLWSLSDSKSPQVLRTLLYILAVHQ